MNDYFLRVIFCCLMSCCLASCSSQSGELVTPLEPATTRAELNLELIKAERSWPQGKYRGWDYLVEKLIAKGIPEGELREIFLDSRLPALDEPIPFSLRPKETNAMYANFNTKKQVKNALSCLQQHLPIFKKSEKQFQVSRFVLASLLHIESQCGAQTGSQPVFYRLARIAAISDPKNIEANFKILLDKDPETKIEEVRQRAQYLDETFFPETLALLAKARQQDLDIFSLKGSPAGAFGIPQFLPSSYLKYGIDGDSDGRVSLFNPADAIVSAAHFLKLSGWKEESKKSQKKQVLWAYNRSDAYGNAVLKLASQIQQSLGARQSS